MSVPNLVRRYLCYDLEACFVQRGCKRGETKLLEVAFKSDDRWSLGQEFDGNSITNEYVGSIDDVAIFKKNFE